MLTAHDFPSAYVADSAGMDMVLVGDSLAMVALGMNDTNAVTLDDMVLHCKSVTRAVRSAFVVSFSFSFSAFFLYRLFLIRTPQTGICSNPPRA